MDIVFPNDLFHPIIPPKYITPHLDGAIATDDWKRPASGMVYYKKDPQRHPDYPYMIVTLDVSFYSMEEWYHTDAIVADSMVVNSVYALGSITYIGKESSLYRAILKFNIDFWEDERQSELMNYYKELFDKG